MQEFGNTPVTVVIVVKKLGAASSQHDAAQVQSAVRRVNASSRGGRSGGADDGVLAGARHAGGAARDDR